MNFFKFWLELVNCVNPIYPVVIDDHAGESIATLHNTDDCAKNGNSPRRYNLGSGIYRSGIHSPCYAWLAPWSLPSCKDATNPTLTFCISGFPSPKISSRSRFRCYLLIGSGWDGELCQWGCQVAEAQSEYCKRG